MSNSYPKKYWWVVLVVVPIAAGLVAIIPEFFGGSSGGGDRITIEGSSVGGDVQIIGTQVILKQLKKTDTDAANIKGLEASINRAVNLVEGGFYRDAISSFEEIAQKTRTPAIYNNLGLLYLLDNRDGQAREAFKEGVALDPSYQPLRVNLARLYSKEGNIKAAIDQLEKAPDEDQARKLLATIKDKASAGLLEQEPNDEILGPNELPLQKNIMGAISTQSDQDYFKFTTPMPPRDIIDLELKNLSTGLKLRAQLWGSDKSHLWSSATFSHQVTSGQNIHHSFSAWPNAVYYLSVSSLGGQGKYEFSLLPRKAFDSYEPNDDILSAKDTRVGTPVEASLLDDADQDYYRIRSTGNAVSVSLTNGSTSLKPRLQIWHADKSHLWSNATYGHQVTGGQDIETSFSTKAGETYYVSVSSLGGNGGYTLALTQSE